MNSIFAYMTSLKTLDVRNMDFTNISGYDGTSLMFDSMPNDTLIYVKSQEAKDFLIGKYDLTNVQIVDA